LSAKIIPMVLLFLIVYAGAGAALQQIGSGSVAAQQSPDWIEADPVKVVIDSTADWGRIMFDDLNGTNTNGLRIHSVVSSGWTTGKDEDDVLNVGRKITFPDTNYNRIITRKGDIVSFFKGLGDFHYTEAYAVLVLDVDVSLQQVYVWLMMGGNGTTTFEIVSQTTGGTIWQDVLVGNGQTQQVKRVLTPQPFFKTGRTEDSVVVAWLVFGIMLMILLNFPVFEAARRRIRRRRNS